MSKTTYTNVIKWKALQYDGDEWGILDVEASAWVCFGTENEMKAKLAELEAE